MMGTDQRDMFVAELRRAIETSVPNDGHIFDFGAGDGQTFALVADSVPQGTRVSIEDPNPEYLANYRAFLKTKAHLRPGVALAAEFDEIDAAAKRLGEKLPPDGSIDLGLALHMIYFVNDLPASVKRMVRRFEGLEKFEAAAALLRHNPEAVDLRVEDDGPRKGMWSVTQPQWVAALRRTR